jgi:hypothetical protein
MRFGSGKAYFFGVSIFKEISRLIGGRACGDAHKAGILAQVVANSGDGDHLEIGTLFGASAILAAVVKEKYNIGGRIVCIDPLTGYYGLPKDPESQTAPSAKLVMSNADIFGVRDRIELITEPSEPWPLPSCLFISAYIDGDHENGQPWRDFLVIQGMVDRYIVFDDLDAYDVALAVVRAKTNEQWIVSYACRDLAVLRRS